MINFVGAGPGAVDLITVRGMELLKKADVVIYAGSLVNPGLLDYVPSSAEIYDSAGMTLEEVMQVMIAAHRDGKEVVRLHTGEPSLYGAVREQMDILDREGIGYASCPGVSACFGAAADMNLEYTLPGVSQTLIITRLEGRTGVPEKESMQALASHGASMAIVYKATWPEEKILPCTVKDLAETAKKAGVSKTAVVLVGRAVGTKDYERSKLYDPTFSTGYRAAKEE